METHSQSPSDLVMFAVERILDPTGTSGIGHVLDGVVFHTGQVVVCWRGDLKRDSGVSSIGIYPSVKAFVDVHLAPHGHDSSRVVFVHGSCEALTDY